MSAEDTEKHNEVEPVDLSDALLSDETNEFERFLNEINLLKLEGRLFCFDPKEAKRRTQPLTFEDVTDKPLIIEPHPNYGQPSVLAYKVLQAIFLKLTKEGFPAPETISFTQRELGALVGRQTFGGRDAKQLYQAMMQLRSVLVHGSFHDKAKGDTTFGNFNIVTDALFSKKKDQITQCTITIHPWIIASLNNRHFACFNWHRLQHLEPIGAALYKRLFFHFSNLMKPRMEPRSLKAFEKDYQDICAEWLGGLKPEQYRSRIISNQLGRHLEALKRSRLIRKYGIEKKADGGWKLVFYPGNGFFNDYEEFYAKQWQPQLRFQQTADLRNIQQPLELVAYFHGLLGHDHNTFEEKETAYASQLLNDYLYADLRDFVAFAVAAAKETDFKMQSFGAVRQYLPRWLTQREKRAEERRRRELVATCPHCDEAGYIRMLDTRGNTIMTTCPHDLSLIEALEQHKGYRRMS